MKITDFLDSRRTVSDSSTVTTNYKLFDTTKESNIVGNIDIKRYLFAAKNINGKNTCGLKNKSRISTT